MNKKIQKFIELLKFDNWFELLISLVFFRRSNIYTYRYKGVSALVDHSSGDQDGVKVCLVPGLYGAFFDEIFPKIGNKPLIILDLGANTGGFPLALKAAGKKIISGLCVELNPITCSRLAWNIAQNELFSDVKICNAAICATEALLEVSLTKGSVGDSLYNSSKLESEEYEFKIPGMTVDQAILKIAQPNDKIDICKIDIEGAEYEAILEGSSEKIVNCRFLIIEIHKNNNYSEDDIISYFSEIGFQKIIPKLDPIESNVFLFEMKKHIL